jgi:hypothetical protein
MGCEVEENPPKVTRRIQRSTITNAGLERGAPLFVALFIDTDCLFRNHDTAI